MLLNFLQSAFSKPSRLLLAASLSMGLVACGGGGGSAGDIPGQPVQPPGSSTVASVTLSTSTTSMTGSSEVTLTAVAKDAGNNALKGVTISFAASSGVVSTTNRVTDATGTVTEKLTSAGDATPRAITVTAAAGSVTSAAKTINVVAGATLTPKLQLTSSVGTLPSTGAGTNTAQIRALVIDTDNVIVPNAVVTFSTSSGSLSAKQKTTDAAGIASVSLDAANDPTNRVITVTAKVDGAPDATVTVAVVGTKLAVNAASSLNLGSTTDLTATLTDSSGNALAGRAVTFSAVNGTLTTKAGAASPSVTDTSGKIVLSYTGKVNGPDTVTLSSLGETATATINTVSSNFTVSVVDGTPGAYVPRTVGSTDICNMVLVHDFSGSGATARVGTVAVSTSRGTLYSDNSCTTVLTGPRTLAAGEAVVYLKATSPGLVTLNATGLTSVQGQVEITAPLTSTAAINVQATPAVIGANSSGNTSQQSVLRAVVLDRPVSGNPVKNARVAFSIVTDPSGGVLSQPSEAITDSDGSATVSYIAGPTSTGTDGVVIRAQVLSSVTSVSSTAALTVSQRSLFISAGTGSTLFVDLNDPTTYRLDYAVFVTDSAGNPVPNVTVTASVRPRTYSKGTYRYNGTIWEPVYTVTCLNEDVDRNGVLTPAEDASGNNNGRLDPGNPVNITGSAITGANGTARVSMTYPRDRANWLNVDFVIRGAVAGSESSYVGAVVLPFLSTDFDTFARTPPGSPSPYGKSNSCSDTL